MKKLISLIIIILFFAIGWMNTSMANFSMDMKMDIKISTSENNISKICKTINHSCCIVPFNNSSTAQYNGNKNNNENSFKLKVIDYDFLSLLNEKNKSNLLNKLISPPNNISFFVSSNKYIDLVGIIKNNS